MIDITDTIQNAGGGKKKKQKPSPLKYIWHFKMCRCALCCNSVFRSAVGPDFAGSCRLCHPVIINAGNKWSVKGRLCSPGSNGSRVPIVEEKRAYPITGVL